MKEAADKRKEEAAYFEEKYKDARDQKDALASQVSALSGQVVDLEHKLDMQTQRAADAEHQRVADSESWASQTEAQAKAHVDQLKTMKDALAREEQHGRDNGYRQ